MKKTKLLSLFIAVSISTSLMIGCGENDSSDASKSSKSNNKDVTISMLLCDYPTAPYSNDWKVLQWIKEKTGVTFETQVAPASDFKTKVNMAFNSGNVPDFVTHTFPSADLALTGQLLPINKYMDKLPNLEKFIKDHGFEERWNDLKDYQGNIYLVPTMVHSMNFQSHLWSVRKDIFEKNNIPIPKTLDEVIEAGKKLKEIYPDSTPICNRYSSNNIMAGIAPAYGTIAGYNFGDGSYYNRKTKSYEFAPISQNWKDMITEVNKMYTSGVLDKEYSTLDSSVYEQRITQGKTFILYDWSEYNPKYEVEGKKIDPDYDLEVIYPPTGYEGKYATQQNAPWNMAMVMPASLADDPKHLDEVLKYLNWAYSDEAETLLTFGKEGETYKVENGVKKYIDDKDYQKECGIPHNCLSIREDMDYYLGAVSKEQRDLITKISNECIPMANPTSPLTEDDMDKIQVYQTSLKDYCISMMEKFINGSEPLSNWDKYVQSCKDKGCDKMIDVYNQALKKAKR